MIVTCAYCDRAGRESAGHGPGLAAQQPAVQRAEAADRAGVLAADADLLRGLEELGRHAQVLLAPQVLAAQLVVCGGPAGDLLSHAHLGSLALEFLVVVFGVLGVCFARYSCCFVVFLSHFICTLFVFVLGVSCVLFIFFRFFITLSYFTF